MHQTMQRAEPLRVAHVALDLNGGGLETLVGSLATHLAGSSVAVSVITLKGQAGRVGEAIRPLVDQFHVLRPLRTVSMAAPVSLIRAMRRARPDVVHLHSGCWHKGVVAARLAGVPKVIYTEHGRIFDDSALTCWWQRRLAGITDRVVTVSDRLQHQMASYVGIPPSRICTIENGVDVSAMCPGPKNPKLMQHLGLSPDTVIVGSVGRLEPVKAYDRLVRAFAEIVKTNRIDAPLALVVCGDGAERPRLLHLAQQAGVADRTRLPGWVDAPLEYYRLFDVFAMTSRSEGLSVSLLEALACGIPPVVTDVGANAQVLGPALARGVVPEGDPAAFRQCLLQTLLSEERKQLADAARRRAVEQYSIERMVAEYTALYRA